MPFEVDEFGNITLVQGDSGTLVVNDLSTDKNYTIYFAIQDKDRNPVGDEISVTANKVSSIAFEIPGNLTDLLTVPKKQETAEYYYGIKLCSEEFGYEDTAILGNSNIGDKNTITVFPKKVEGI